MEPPKKPPEDPPPDTPPKCQTEGSLPTQSLPSDSHESGKMWEN